MNGGIAAAGLATSVATAGVVAIIHEWTGFNLFAFSIDFIPAGAGLCGFLAASGYYLAAKALHQRPTGMILAQTVVIAASTQTLIYWLEYRALAVNGLHIADVMSFGQYLDLVFTNTHMKIGRAAQTDIGRVGDFGYLLALVHFLGFLGGGVLIYIFLKDQPICERCEKYLKPALRTSARFVEQTEFLLYYASVYDYPVDSPEFVQHLARPAPAGKPTQGHIAATTTIYECSSCFRQAIIERVQMFDGRYWKYLAKLRRRVELPEGVDMRMVFRSLQHGPFSRSDGG